MNQIATRIPAGHSQMLLLDVVYQLEINLAQLDEMGAHLAAAHVDAAIARLREQAALKRAS